MTGSDRRAGSQRLGDHTAWSPTRIAGVGILLAGIVAACAIVALRGFSGATLAQLLTISAVLLVGAGASAVPDSIDAARMRTLQVILWMVGATALCNLALAWIDLDRWVWRAPAYFPFTEPIGTDFRNGAYVAAQHFSNAASGWPPFTLILSAPYLLFGPNTAYGIHVCVLVGLNIAALLLAAAAARRTDGDDLALGPSAGVYVGPLASAIAVWLFLSFGFLLSVERGNFDAFAAFFAMLGLWAMVRRSEGVWLPAIAFSVAAQIKVYPAMLFLLLVWRYRWKSVLPLIVCNVVLGLSAGPKNLENYLPNMTRSMGQGADWVGNSSAHSFSTWVDWLGPRYLPHLSVTLLLAVPVVVFLLTAWRLWRRQDHTATVLMLCGMVPIMCVIPSISHDYKVVLFAGPAVLLAALLMKHVGRGSAEPWWMLLALTGALFFLARVPGQLVDYSAGVERFVWPAVLMNKYPSILLFQIVVAWMAWRLPAPEVAETLSGRPPTKSPGLSEIE